MFPLVPYHALPRLHEAVKDDCPAVPQPARRMAGDRARRSLRQVKDPAYHVKRRLPEPQARRDAGKPLAPTRSPTTKAGSRSAPPPTSAGPTCIRFDHGKKTYRALPRRRRQALRDRRHLHARQHASGRRPGEGQASSSARSTTAASTCRTARRPAPRLPRPGDLPDRGAQRPASPQCRPAGRLRAPARRRPIQLPRGQQPERRHLHQGAGPRAARLGEASAFTPGDYLQLDIPAYETIRFRDFDIPEPYAAVWEAQHVFDLVARNPEAGAAQQLLAGQQPAVRAHAALQCAHRHAAAGPGLPARRRLQSTSSTSSPATPSRRSARSAISTSSRPSARWSTSAAAPAWRRCARTSHTFSRREQTARKVSFWYGARSRQEIFYEDYFQDLARNAPELHLPPRPLIAAAGGQLDRPRGLHPRGRSGELSAGARQPEGGRILPLRSADDDQGLHQDARRARRAHRTRSPTTNSDQQECG